MLVAVPVPAVGRTAAVGDCDDPEAEAAWDTKEVTTEALWAVPEPLGAWAVGLTVLVDPKAAPTPAPAPVLGRTPAAGA